MGTFRIGKIVILAACLIVIAGCMQKPSDKLLSPMENNVLEEQIVEYVVQMQGIDSTMVDYPIRVEEIASSDTERYSQYSISYACGISDFMWPRWVNRICRIEMADNDIIVGIVEVRPSTFQPFVPKRTILNIFKYYYPNAYKQYRRYANRHGFGDIPPNGVLIDLPAWTVKIAKAADSICWESMESMGAPFRKADSLIGIDMLTTQQ